MSFVGVNALWESTADAAADASRQSARFSGWRRRGDRDSSPGAGSAWRDDRVTVGRAWASDRGVAGARRATFACDAPRLSGRDARRPGEALRGRLRRTVAYTMAVLAVLLALLAAYCPAQATPTSSLDTRETFHLYIIDLSSIAEPAIAVSTYVAHRWRDFAGASPSGGQRGLVVLLDGVRGPGIRRIDLSPNDRNWDQERRIHDDVAEAFRNRSPDVRRGLELNEAAAIAREQIRAQVDQTIATFKNHNRNGGLMVVIHLIGDEIVYTPRAGGGTVSLHERRYPDSCYGPGALADQIADFPRAVRLQVPGADRAALRGLLVLVPTGKKRFAPEAERAAGLQMFGGALFERTAAAIHDALGCLEVQAAIAFGPRDGAVCGPAGAPRPTPRADRPPGSCVRMDDSSAAQQRAGIIQQRIDEVIRPLTAGTDMLVVSAAPSGPPQQAALPAAAGPSQPGTSRPATPSGGGTAAANPPGAPSQQGPTPPPPSASIPTPPGGGPSQPGTSRPATPSGGGTAAANPPGAPSQQGPTPPPPSASIPTPPGGGTATATPSGGGTAAANPPGAPSQQGPTPPPPSASIPTPPARMTALTTRTSPAQRLQSTRNINARLAGAPAGTVTLHLLPPSQLTYQVQPRDRFDVTNGSDLHFSSNPHRLVARVAPTAACDANGGLSFKFTLFGRQFGENPPGEFSVNLSDACRATGRTVFIATVTIP